MAVRLLKDLHGTVKNLAFNACMETLESSGFTIDDSNFYMTKDLKLFQYRNTKFSMSFVKQRAKLKCCQRICRFVIWVDFILQSHLHEIVRNQIMRFKADVHRHFQYVPSDNLLSDTTDVEAVLEGERSTDDPKVITSN